jgi:hypothetical protein
MDAGWGAKRAITIEASPVGWGVKDIVSNNLFGSVVC